MGVGTIIELTYGYLLCTVALHQGVEWFLEQKRVVLILRLVKIPSSYGLLLAFEFTSHPDVQEFYYEDEEKQAQVRVGRQKREWIAIVGGNPMGVEMVTCGRADGAFQHLRDDFLVILVHGGLELFPAMDVDLRKRELRTVQAQGVAVRLSTWITEVGQDYITIF
ncbi:LOW QUALITY PROTEIN: hypothetical protein ACHAWX_004435 [Stephanocyclus meneghinianus]